MFGLLRRDPIIGSQSIRWGVIAALNASVMAGLVTSLAATSQALVLGHFANLILLATITWLNMALLPIFGKARERCRPLDMALPLPGQKLWLSHILALTLSGLGYLALTIGVLELLFWVFRKAPLAFSALQQALGDLIVPICVCFILVVVLLQSIGPTLYRIPRTRKYTLYSFAIAISALGLILGLSVLPPLTSLVPLGLAFCLGYRTYRSVPPAFTLVPFEADASDAPASQYRAEAATGQIGAQDWRQDAEARGESGIRHRWYLFRLLFRSPAWLAGLFLYPFLFILGFIFSGFLSAWLDVELSPQFSWVLLVAYNCLTMLPALVSQLHFIGPLPISRRLIFPILMLPSLLALSAGYGAGGIGTALVQPSRLQIQCQQARSSFIPSSKTQSLMVRIPAQYCEIAWGGQPPDSVSPWGESHPAWKSPLYRGSRIAVYSPFSTPEGCSQRFVAWQISRAIQAIYGKTVPYQQILDHYLEAEGNGSVELKNGGLLLLRDYHDLRPQREIAVFPVHMMMIGVTYLLMDSIYFRACRASVTDAGRKAVFYGLLVPTLGLTVVGIKGFAGLDVAGAFVRVLIREAAQTLPGGNFAIWILCALPFLVGYWLVQAGFQRIEVLPGRASR